MTVKEFKEIIEKYNLNDDTEIMCGDDEKGKIWKIRIFRKKNSITLYGAVTEKKVYIDELDPNLMEGFEYHIKELLSCNDAIKRHADDIVDELEKVKKKD